MALLIALLAPFPKQSGSMPLGPGCQCPCGPLLPRIPTLPRATPRISALMRKPARSGFVGTSAANSGLTFFFSFVFMDLAGALIRGFCQIRQQGQLYAWHGFFGMVSWHGFWHGFRSRPPRGSCGRGSPLLVRTAASNLQFPVPNFQPPFQPHRGHLLVMRNTPSQSSAGGSVLSRRQRSRITEDGCTRSTSARGSRAAARSNPASASSQRRSK